MLLLQASGDFTETAAYKLGYSVGYFVGENSTLIFVIAGLIFALVLYFVFKWRKNRLSDDL